MTLDLKSLPAIFPLLGLLLALRYVWGALDFIWFYYLRPTSWTRLLRPSKPYALITGATDGIGKSTAKELYTKGFNLILHGRNEEKMKRAVEEVRAANPASGLDIKYFIADVGRPDVDFGGIANQFEGLNITLFVNNVGASLLTNERYVSLPSCLLYALTECCYRIDQMSEEVITSILNVNARFPYFITRAFLPSLRKNSQNGPVEVVFIGSIGGDVAVPFLSPYAGSKALTKRVCRILHADERVWSGSNLSFVYANVGEVQSGTMKVKVSLTRPGSDDFARHLVQSFGSGRRVVIPHPVHHVIYSIVTGMPEVLCDYIVSIGAVSLFKEIDAGKKNQ